MTKEEAEAYIKSAEYLDAPLNMPCRICDQLFETTRRKLGDYTANIYCAGCEVNRAKDPDLFDCLVRIMESKIEQAAKYERSYDDDR